MAVANIPETLSGDIEEVRRLLETGGDVGFDLETTGLRLSDRIVTVAAKPRGKRMYLLDMRHRDVCEAAFLLAPLLRDSTVTLVGHNLYFDLQKLMAVGIYPRGVKFYDTMLAEYLIYGVGRAEALVQKISMSLLEVGERYGAAVEKEARNWFIDLDTRVEGATLREVGREKVEVPCPDEAGVQTLEGTLLLNATEVPVIVHTEKSSTTKGPCFEEQPIMESVGGWRPWDVPFPLKQIDYMRQDVSVVHWIKAKQEPAIAEKELDRVVALENRVIPATAMMRVVGVRINRTKWQEVLAEAESQGVQLEEELHAALDNHILRAREEKHTKVWEPWAVWDMKRTEFLTATKEQWDGVAKGVATKLYENTDGTECHTWAQYKKAATAWWEGRYEKLTRPPALKSGVNLGSWQQVLDGLHGYGKERMAEALLHNDTTQYQVAERLTTLTSTSDEVLAPLAELSPIIQTFITYQGARKIKVAYGEAFLERLDSDDRMHADYNQLGTGTGRYSSYNGSTGDGANFQQIPSRGLGAKFREAIEPAPGYSFVNADFSNIELRIVAEFSGDPNLLAAFASGVDVHAQTSVIMFGLHLPAGVDIKEYTNTHNAVVGGHELPNTPMRSVGKTINFMSIYGGGVKRLAAILRIQEHQSKRLMDIYWNTFRVALDWIKAQGEKEYATTASGRRRYIPKPHPPHAKAHPTLDDIQEWQVAYNEYRRQVAGRKRSLGNAPIQGTSADITKLSLALLYEKIAEAGLWEVVRIVACVHDELLVEASNAAIPDTEGMTYAMLAREWLKWAMETAQAEYLHTVALPEVNPTITDFWHHD